MPRILETEVMNDPLSVDAYNDAHSKTSLSTFALSQLTTNFDIKTVADLGCGSCNYYSKLFEIFPVAKVTGFDASKSMLEKAKTNTITMNTEFIEYYINSIPDQKFDLVSSFLTLHQLPNPNIMWDTIKRISNNNNFILFDLLRVEEDSVANEIVNFFSPTKDNVFDLDFKNSLKAAFTEEEIKQQLKDNDIKATTKIIELSPIFKTILIIGEPDVR